MRISVLALLAACATAPDAQPLPVDQAALAYSNGVSAAIPGQLLTSTLYDLSGSSSNGIPDGTTTAIRVGTQLAYDLCPTQLFGECMDIGFPGVDSAPAILTNGVAVNSIRVPRALADGTTVFVQTAGMTRGGFTRAGGVTERRVGCGDGVVGVAEQCDDGNINGRDGCDQLCLLEYDNEVIWGGIRYANCVGDECNYLARFEFAPNVFLSTGDYDSANTSSGDNTGQLTLLGQQLLANASGDADAASPLDPTYGCPNCYDQGELYFLVTDRVNGGSMEVVVDPDQVPPALAKANQVRRSVLQALSTCVPNIHVTPHSDCVPL